jgi:aconitase B
MEPDDMVPALEEAHRLVVPGGTVIDIHPVPGAATAEVYRDGAVVFADSASASDGEDEVRAGEALAHVVARGLFAAERRAE